MTPTEPKSGSSLVTGSEHEAPANIARQELSISEAESISASLWDQDVLSWERYWVPVFTTFAHDLVSDASLSPGDIVLDVGTGSGAAAFEARKAVRSEGIVVGIDRCAPMITLARKKASKARLRNVRFFQVSAENPPFPEDFFDVVISNCGIPIAGLSAVLSELLRILRHGGRLVLNDWHLIDVKPHRIFGDVLGKNRTTDPSPELARERSALAKLESYHRSLSSEVQARAISDAGFKNVIAIKRQYKVHLKSLDFYLKMRMTRATIRREISEMSPDRRVAFRAELRERLRHYVRGGRFILDWPVFYITAKKP